MVDGKRRPGIGQGSLADVLDSEGGELIRYERTCPGACDYIGISLKF